MNSNAIKVGITGAPASGKSFVASSLIKLGYKVFDADLEVKKLYQNPEVCAQIALLFPQMQGIDKAYIANIIYNDDAKRQQINAIFHPRIRELLASWLEENSNCDIIFADIPLLYEANFSNYFDYILCVYVDAEERKSRFVARQGAASLAMFELIEKAQLSLAQKVERSDFVINTQGPEHETIEQIKNIINKINND